ncbi:protein mono-ADP-ribosyltransferase PARP14-like isoform X2 [Narcine bancroftii]|uniref:protein mono-ADP-ribosyltransferase PARP14-like isoform X2 n=1 Tax=Narcine bancroftii TaxID=1343680 RepID=UPI0038315E55
MESELTCPQTMMARFPVLVEGLHVDLQSVKKKLTIYFQTKRKSGGGECEIKALPDQTKFLVYFKSEQVQKEVAKKEFHMVQLLDPKPIQLQVSIYKEDIGRESSLNSTGVNRESATGQSQLLTSLDHLSKPEQGQPNTVPIQESPLLHQESASEYSSNQLLVSSDGPVDTVIVAMFFEKISPDVVISGKNENSWILTCPSHNDLKKIISQEQYTVAGSILNVQLYNKCKEDEKYESRTFILKGFDGISRLEHISLYIDSLSNSAEHNIEPLQDGTSVVVTFKTNIDDDSFVWDCCQKAFEDNTIIAHRLRKTDSVKVEGLHPDTNEDLLDLYFSNTNRSGGGEIKEIHIKADERTAVLCFCNPEVVRTVLERQHFLKNSQLTVGRYYPDQHLSLYGTDGLKVKHPEQCSIYFNPSLLNFLRTNMHLYNHELEQITKDLYCNIEISPNSKQINLKPSLDANVLWWYKIADNWKKNATEAVQKFMARFHFKVFPLEQDLWERVQLKSKQLVLPGLDVIHLPMENKIVVVGKEGYVLDASRKLQDILIQAKEKLEKERNTIEEEIPLESFEELEFLQTNVKDVLSFVETTTKNAPPLLKLKGMRNRVEHAHKIINYFRSQLEKKPLNLSNHMKDFIKTLDLKTFVQAHFVQNNLKATLIVGEAVELLAIKTDVKKVEDEIKNLFQEETVDIIPVQIQVTQDDKWTRFLDDLKSRHKSSCKIVEGKNPTSIIIVGFSNNVSDAAKALKSYLNKKQITMKFISAQAIEVDYMANFLILPEEPDVKIKGVTIEFIKAPSSGLKVIGRAEQIDEAVSAIKDKLSQVCKQTFTYSNAGESIVLTKQNDALQAKARSRKCMLLIKTKEDLQTETSIPKYVSKQADKDLTLPVPLAQVSKLQSGPTVQVGHVTVELKKGDITQERTDVIVNSTNSTLNSNSGVSGAILKAAGSSVEKECTSQGSQPNGSVVVTSGGQLPCQYIVHVVNVTSASITVSVSKVLEECEQLNITAAAFPAMGTGKCGTSGETAINAIFTGLENYFLNVTSSNMKNISIVAFEQHIYDCFADFFDKRKLSSSASATQTKTVVTTSSLFLDSSTAPVNFTIPDQPKDPLPTQLQIQNVIVEVKQGDITQENVGAIVNSTNTTLNLNSGVSKIILEKGGKTVVAECKQLGRGKIKPLDSAVNMLIGFENHLKRNQSSTIRFIYLVVFEESVYKVFNEVLQNSQEKMKIIRINIGNVEVLATFGDIVDERTDAIVNSTNVNLDLDTGISQAILIAGGKPLVDECEQMGVQSLNSVVTTGAGKLHGKYVLHLIDWTETKDIKGSIRKVLNECERLQINSVSFPAIGTGAGKRNPSDVANAFLDAISEYVRDFVPPALSMIRIVLFTPVMFHLFSLYMKQRFKICQPDEPTTLPVSDSHPIKQVKPDECVYPVILSTKKYLTSTVEIYGMTNDNIDMVRNDVENVIKENCKSKIIENKGGSFLSLNQRQKCMEFCENLQVKVEIQKDYIIINGYTDEVLEFIVQFNSLVQSAKDQMSRKQEEAQIKKFVQWELLRNGKFQPYDQSLNCDIEKAYQDKKETLKYEENEETWIINFKKKQMEDSKGNVFIISRRLLEGGTFELPATWSNMINQEFLVKDLEKDTEEYNKVTEKFTQSSKNQATIIKIERIQNRKLWQSYSVRKQTVERKIPGTNIEQILYHGTTKEIAQKVIKTGFNRSFCGRNATAYGKGTYFALNAAYSCDNKYSNPDEDECKYIYQARVITGNKCVGNKGMLEPAPVNAQGDATDLCDCAVDNLKNPKIFVIFCDDGAYPEYLITFKAREG